MKKILFATAEGSPFIKTGGLGDVAYALPLALSKKEDFEVSVIMPYYKSVEEKYGSEMEFVTSVDVPLSWRNLYCGIFRCKLGKVTYYFIDNKYYFERDNLYGSFDDGERYAFFCKAVLEVMPAIGYFPDVIHANDWQCALIPLFLKANYSYLKEYKHIKTVFSIHNIEYQGKASYSFLGDVLGLSDIYMKYLNFEGCINFMHSAILLADKISTVSKTYAFEIQNAYYAHGLENVLSAAKDKLTGIVNGIDTDLFNPRIDKNITVNYDYKSFKDKAKNKLHLQKILGLKQDGNTPIIAMITRLVAHKGIDLVEFVSEELLKRDIQLVVLGMGDPHYEWLFHSLEERYQGKVSANIKFDDALASKIYAGADMFLMPSNSEPCGLAQMIAMRYGAIAIVRETGGLVDTVSPINEETLEGRGFTFKSYNAHDMMGAIDRAIDVYKDKDKWEIICTNVMQEDFGWEKSADEYLELYFG